MLFGDVKMRVLLLNPPAEKGFIRTGRWTRKSRANQQWYPIWLAYCAGFLQKHGFEVELYDAAAKGNSYDAIYWFVRIVEPDVILYYWCYDNIDDDLLFADLLAKYSRVILVGPWSLCAPEALLKTKRIHIMTYGEFEHTVLELLEQNHYTDVKGVIWKNHITGEIVKNPPRLLCSSKELDEMPFVTSIYKQFLNLKLYRQTSFKFPFIDLFGARGCPNRCLSVGTLVKMWNSEEKKIELLNKNDKVFTNNGYGLVVEKRTYNEETILVKLGNNEEISVTPDHKFYTKRGWVQAKDLTNRDEVQCLN